MAHNPFHYLVPPSRAFTASQVVSGSEVRLPDVVSDANTAQVIQSPIGTDKTIWVDSDSLGATGPTGPTGPVGDTIISGAVAIVVLDDITPTQDGIINVFNLEDSAVAVSPFAETDLLITHGGVIQQPVEDYTISGSTVSFVVAPDAGIETTILYLASVYAGQWTVGAGVPSDANEANGDMYLNSTTGDVYGPKAAGAWGGIAANILGPAGPVGPVAIDWTLASAGTIHSTNYVDNDTTYVSSDFTHNALTGYVAAEHIDWALTNGANIHADNYTDTGDTTYVSSDFTHDDLTGFVAAEHIDWALTNGANIHADNYTDTDTTYVSSDFTHDNLTGFVAAEHIDWALTNVANIHADNYTDTDTTYVSSDFTHNALTGFVAAEHIDWALTNAANIHADNYTDTGDTTYVSSDFTHDDLTGFVAAEHIDWALTNAANIHADNYTSFPDQTNLTGITDTKANFDIALSDGNFIFVGDAPTAHNHTISEVTDADTATQTLTNKTYKSFTNDIFADHIHEQLRNETGVALAIGDAVYVSGYSVGQEVALVTIADASAAASMPAIAILDEATLAHNATGDFVEVGTVRDMDTSAWAVGDELYISTVGTSGNTLTNVKPTGSALIQEIGIVLRSHATLGIIEMFGAGRIDEAPNIANTKIWIGDASGVPQEFALSGDVTMTAGGAVTIAVDAVDIAMLSATGTPSVSNFLRGDNVWATPAGSGDMVLADAQTNAGIKTFLDTTMKLRNVANTFDGYFVNTNLADRIYTLPDVAGTVALLADIATDSAVAANTAKATNVSTDLSLGTVTSTTVVVNSSDGTNATLVAASTTDAGLLTAAKWDEITANTLKTKPTLSVHATLIDPVATDDITFFFTPVAITVTDVRSHITGTTNVVFNVGHAATRTGTQLDVFTADITLTSTAGQSNSTGFSDATIPANSWVWLECVSVSGTPTMLHTTVIFTED